MKKILIIHTKYKNLGGEDIAVENEYNFLKTHNNVEILYFDNNKISFLSDFIGFITNNNYKSNKILKNTLERFKPDLAIVHNTWFKGNLGIFKILKKYNIKTFVKLHNFRYSCTSTFLFKHHLYEKNNCSLCGLVNNKKRIFNKYFDDSYLKSLAVLLYGRRYIGILNNNSTNLIVLTEHHKKYIEMFLDKKKKVRVYPNVLNLNKISNKEHNYDHENYLLYAGRISKEKGVENLIDAFINTQIRDLKLKIIGIGPELNYLKNKFKSNKNILFFEELSNYEVLEEIKNSKGVITATKLFEGQPTLLCEASFLGVPSIFPKTGGIEEFFPPKYNFMFEQFNYRDLEIKIKNLISLKDNKIVGEENKKYIEKYLDKENMLKKFNEIIIK